MSQPVSAFAPASVSNVACGFDILGFAIDGPGDVVTGEPRDEPGVVILEITGDGGRLPTEASRNTAGVAATALLDAAGMQHLGVGLRIDKRMPFSSGLGSSAASAVAAVVAVDALFELGADQDQRLHAALAGERLISGAIHADNVAPCMLGGFVLVRSVSPLDIVQLPVPEDLCCAVVRPHVEIETKASRGVLGTSVELVTAARQWGNVGALVAALYRGDLELLGRSLEDHVAEPKRAPLVPGFAAAKAAAIDSGALGCSLSGSGPSIFALCADRAGAEATADAMIEALRQQNIDADRMVSKVGAEGARRVRRAHRV